MFVVPVSSVLFFLICGFSIGSFLNVVVFRYGTGFSVGGRSQCLSCSKALTWYELIPVVSYCMQKGRCRGCRSIISPQYPLVEFLTGLTFVAVSLVGGSSFFVSYSLVCWSLLIALAVYDFRHGIIPDGFLVPFTLLALGHIFFFSITPLLDLSAGILLPLPFLCIWIFSKGRLMGFGDIKLMAGLGWFLGFAAGLNAIVLAFWIGAMVSISIMASQHIPRISRLFGKGKGLTMKSEVPFGPFLILGAAIVSFLGFYVFSFPLF